MYRAPRNRAAYMAAATGSAASGDTPPKDQLEATIDVTRAASVAPGDYACHQRKLGKP